MAGADRGIYKRKDGRFEGRFIAAYDEQGKAKYKAVYGRSKAEVREKLEAAKRELLGASSVVDERTFQQVAKAWLADNQDMLARTTYDRYLDALKRDIYPEYADTPIVDITEAEINRFIKVAPELAKKRGRTLKNSTLQVVKAVMSKVLQYAGTVTTDDSAGSSNKVNSYEELTIIEIEKVCLQAKYHHCPEMLAALLSLFCGLRTGELCGLGSDDVDLERMELYIHCTVHRVKNQDLESQNKTVVVVEELARKKQIRRVSIPAVLKDYIAEFLVPGKMLIRGKEESMLMDPRSMEYRLNRMLEDLKKENINFERLRKTYLKGKADEEILVHIFWGTRPMLPYTGSLDTQWLREEMSRDLAPLRLLLGFSQEEMSDFLGVSVSHYRNMERGSGKISWNQYLALLFLFHYNGRTIGIVEHLGLFPQSLKEDIKIGG